MACWGKLVLRFAETRSAASAQCLTWLLEWSGSILGLIGAWLLAANVDQSRFGYVAFLASSLLLLWYSVRARAWGLLMMQLGFVGANTLGVARWIF